MKITKFDADVSNVSQLPDIPTIENGYTADVLKKTFDRAGEAIKEYINGVLIEELCGGEGALKIGSAYIETVEGDSVQEKLETVGRKLSELAGGSIPDGTVTPEKFVESVRLFMTEGGVRVVSYSEAGEYVFVPSKSGNHKIKVQGAGGGGSVAGNRRCPYGGGSGAYAEAYIRLEKGKEYKLTVGAGGAGLCVTDEKKMLSDAEEGGESAFFDGENKLVWAEGGKIKNHADGEAAAGGGIFGRSGAYPLFSGLSSLDDSCFAIGAPSALSPGVYSAEVSAGSGAGGWGSYMDITDGTYIPGTKGGDGLIMIEWLEG